MKKELVAPILSDSNGNSEGSDKLELETMAQRTQKASGPLFGSSPAENSQKPESLTLKIQAFIADIKYATSGDD